MEANNIIDKISTLPPEAQRQVKDFVDFLRIRYGKPVKDASRQIQDLKNEAFIGIWKDREDMNDSGKWVRTKRKAEWRGPGA
jgi:hypothetical protein